MEQSNEERVRVLFCSIEKKLKRLKKVKCNCGKNSQHIRRTLSSINKTLDNGLESIKENM